MQGVKTTMTTTKTIETIVQLDEHHIERAIRHYAGFDPNDTLISVVIDTGNDYLRGATVTKRVTEREDK